MKTKSEVEHRVSERKGRSTPSPWFVVVLLALGVLLGRWNGGAEPQLFAFDPQSSFGEDDGPYTFIPFRRNLWVIHHEEDEIQFFMYPSSEERPIQPSRKYKIDRTEFPAGMVRYQVSDHNVTSFLWILNPETGKGRYVKALRDGKIEASILLDVTKPQ